MGKMNGWQRIGVILSVLWILYGAIHTRNQQVESAVSFQASQLRLCVNGAVEMKAACFEDASINYAEALAINSDRAMEIALVAFMPVLLGWIALWVVCRLYGWVVQGFKNQKG